MSQTMLNRAARQSFTRAPKVATQGGKTSTIGNFNIGSSSLLSGDKAWKEAYYANVWVYRCAQVIAEDLATLPLRVGSDAMSPGDFDVSHPLAVLLGPPPGSPNPTTSARQLWLWTVVQRIITGAFSWEIEAGPDSGQPMFLWPIPTNRVTPVPTDGGNEYFKGYLVDMGSGMKPKGLTRDQMVYAHRPGATDWRKPESVLEAAKLDISVATMQDRYDFAFLKNDARPATVVVHEAFENVDERDAWRQSFVSTHGGPDNAGKVSFTEASVGGAKPSESMLIETLGMTSKDAQMIQRYDSKLKSIEVAFGVPRSRLGDASASTFANSSEEWKGYWQTTIKNLAWELADAINIHLAPAFGLDVCWFDFSGNPLLRDEPPFDVGEAMPLYRGGVVSLNELRTKVLYLPSVEDGDELVVQEVVVPGATELPGSPNGTDIEPVDTGIEVEPPETVELSAESVPSVRAASVSRLHAFNALRAAESDIAIPDVHSALDKKQKRAAVLRAVSREVTALEKRWERSWDRFFKAQHAAVIARLEGKRGRQMLARANEVQVPLVRAEVNVDAVFDRVANERIALDQSTEMFIDIMNASGEAYAAKFGVAFDIDNVWAQEFIEQRANQLAGNITETSYNGIKKQLVQGAKDGESIPELAKRIDGLFNQTWPNRGTTVARTEVIGGYNGGTNAAMNAYGKEIAAGKEWITSIDDRTRDWHIAADFQIVEADKAFTVNGESLQYPGDPSGSGDNIIMCRCTVAPVAPEDMPGNN